MVIFIMETNEATKEICIKLYDSASDFMER
jgi:hypothetical protein